MTALIPAVTEGAVVDEELGIVGVGNNSNGSKREEPQNICILHSKWMNTNTTRTMPPNESVGGDEEVQDASSRTSSMDELESPPAPQDELSGSYVGPLVRSVHTETFVPAHIDPTGRRRRFGLEKSRRASTDSEGSTRQKSFFGRRNSATSFRKSSLGLDDSVADVDYWIPPPVEGADDPNTPLQVDFRCACFKLTDISTVALTTLVKFVVVFEWNDCRLKGISTTTNDLPGDLWGPDIILENAQNDCGVVYDSFSLLDAATGRLKRTVTFHGHVYNPMSLKE